MVVVGMCLMFSPTNSNTKVIITVIYRLIIYFPKCLPGLPVFLIFFDQLIRFHYQSSQYYLVLDNADSYSSYSFCKQLILDLVCHRHLKLEVHH